MPNIQIDFDVFKALTLRRPNESVTENDVLRTLLGLPEAGSRQVSPQPSEATPTQKTSNPAPPWPAFWTTKGVRFPEGTEFRAKYKGQTHLGRVQRSALVVNGKRFNSPSAAAMSITGGKPINGWRFWQCRMPGEADWKSIKSLRRPYL
jgi:hypothetical protein